MGALKMNMKKALAGLLCACLLLSYNPAFGAVDAAFADEAAEEGAPQAQADGLNDGSGHLSGSGVSQEDIDKTVEDSAKTDTWDADKSHEMSTVVTVSTFDNSLQTACRDSFSATVQDLRNGSVGNTDVSYVWFEVTGGMPSTGDGVDPYNASWKVLQNDAYSAELTDWLTSPANDAIERTAENDVANYHLSLRKMAQANKLADGQKYTFVGTFHDSTEGDPVTLRVSVYTVQNGVVDFGWRVIPGDAGTDLEGTEIEGYIQDGTKLSGGIAPDTSAAKDAMENLAAKDTVEGDGGNYEMGDVLQIGTNPVKLPGSGGLDIPPFNSDGLTLRLPIADEYLHGDDNPNGYKPGDTITVMWAGDDTGKVVPVEATVVVLPDGSVVAETVYPYYLDDDNDGVDDTDWPPLPGYFGIEYDTNRLPDAAQVEGKAEYFSVSVVVNGNGTVSPAEKRYWRVKKGDEPASLLEQASYALAPMSTGGKAYELSSLTLAQAGGGQTFNFTADAVNAAKAGRLDSLRTTLTLTNSPDVFAENSEWVLTASFFESSMTPDEAKGTHTLTVNAVKNDGSSAGDWGGVYVYYYDANGDFMAHPESGNPASSVNALPMLNGAQATIVMVPHAPQDGEYYEVKGVQLRTKGADEEWTGIEFEPQKLMQPFIIPPTLRDVEVNVVFGKSATGGMPTEMYTAEAVVKTPDMGQIVGDSTVTYGATGAVPALRFMGKTEDQYLDYVNVFIGDRTTPERLNVNAEKKNDFTLYLPNYHANIRVEAYFNDAKSPSIELTMTVKTEYANGAVETSTVGGNIVPLNWDMTGMVRSGQKCTVLLSANSGYELSELTEKVGDAAPADRMGNVAGNVWAFVPMDERETADEALRIEVTATFKQKQSTGGDPGDNQGRSSRLAAYVADSGLSQTGDADLDYIFQPEQGAFNSNSDANDEDTNLEAFKAAIAVNGYKAGFGQVNGQTSLFGTVKYNDDYPLSLVGNTLSGTDGTETRYGIEKVLVVTYHYATDPATGVQVKKGLKWSLYHTNVPYFIVENMTTHTDVIAYFAPIGDGTGGSTGDGGFDKESFVKVNVSSKPLAAGTVVSPTGIVPVLKGGSLPLNIALRTADYELKDAKATALGETDDFTDDVKDSAGSSAQTTYSLPNITADTDVVVTYRERPEEERGTWDVTADMYVTEGEVADAEPVGSAAKPCSIMVGSGEGFAQTNYLVNGVGSPFFDGSDLRFALTRDEGYYTLADLSFEWSEPDVVAYRDTAMQDDGTVRHIIRLTTDQSELTGKQPYEHGTPLYGESDEPADASTEVWYVQNLLCPITVKPVYKKIDRSDVVQNSDSWTVTTKVGSGFGQVMTDSPNFAGCTTKVLKRGATNLPLTVSFVPAENYRIADVRVSTSTGNLLEDFWALVTGFIDHLGDPNAEDAMKNEAIRNGSITLAKVTSDYEIIVDFEPIPGAVDPDDDLFDQVAVNVLYDSSKGTVTPNVGLTAKKTDSQQFVVSPKQVGEKFYSVAGVKVSVGDGAATEVRAIDKSSSLVKWGEPFFNTFVVDYSQLSWPSAASNAAVTVEVLFSDTPNADGSGGTATGTPSDDDMKLVTVNVIVDGEPAIGDSGLGGVVSPRGTIQLVPGGDAAGTGSYKQRVFVSPSDDYSFDKILVVLDGDADSGLAVAHKYNLSVLSGNGYFDVEADKPGTEVITVYLKKKPFSERSYTINVGANVADADRFISPHGVITIGNSESQTYSINPDAGYQVASIRDVGIDENGNEVTLPADENGVRGANWTRGDSTAAKSSFTVSPVKVNGKVLDREVTVSFERKNDVNHGLDDADTVNVRVMGIGAGSQFLEFTPSENLTDVLKGTADEPMTYWYHFALTDQAVKDGYAIYWIQNNGTDWFGAVDNATVLRTEGDFAFTTENMTRDMNTLFVYVSRFDGSGSDQNDPSKKVTIDFGCGDGGTIVDKDPGSHRVGTSSGGLTNNTIEAPAGMPFTLLMTPDVGNVLSEVYLHNCYVLDYNWVVPNDDRTTKVALEYTMMVTDESRPARVFALFEQGDANTFRPWDHTHVDDRDAYTTDSTFVVEISPSDGVEALVEKLDDGTPAAGDMLQVSNPVAPFSPQVSLQKGVSSEGDDGAISPDSYAVTFDTISKVSDPNDVRILVGPLIKWDDYENHKSTLYTIDNVNGLQDGFTVTEKPLPGTEVDDSPTKGTDGVVIGEGDDTPAGDDALGDDFDGEEPEPQKFYTYYEIRGALPSDATQVEGQPHVVHIDLRKLALSDGEYPEYANRVPEGMVKLQAQVTSGEGSIVPTSAPTMGTSWFDGNVAGPWIVAQGSTVSFKVKPGADYVLSNLVYNGTDALSNGSFDAETSTLTFRATTSTTVYADFVPHDSPDALRTVTIEVEDGHGTTSPTPGTHEVEKGKPYPVTFVADDGYVPYLIWIDGVQSYVAPTLSGWMLPASWHDQTIKVKYALAGTTPSGSDYLVQTGQNVANQIGTSLVRTGDNPWLPVIVLLLLIAGGAAFGGMRLVHAGEAATRAAKYSVTRREAPARHEEEESVESDKEE